MDIKDKKILLTGGAGFLGSHVFSELIRNKVSKKNIFIPRSKEIDLREKNNCKKAVKGMDILIHLAGNVGGIGKNQNLPATLFYDNVQMGINLIHEAMLAKVKKAVIIGTICSYPKYSPVPFKEEDLWIGYPEETNAPYGLAKKILLVQSQAYRSQYDFNSVYLLLVNMYGPKDNFDPDSSHVIPAIIKKIHEAIKNNKKFIEVWGDGSATREFLYVEDAARGIILALKHYDKPEPINLGKGEEISIKNLVELIADLMGYKGEIQWNTAKPNGQPRRLLDVSKAQKEIHFKAKIELQKGLKKTINWYLSR